MTTDTDRLRAEPVLLDDLINMLCERHVRALKQRDSLAEALRLIKGDWEFHVERGFDYNNERGFAYYETARDALAQLEVEHE